MHEVRPSKGERRDIPERLRGPLLLVGVQIALKVEFSAVRYQSSAEELLEPSRVDFPKSVEANQPFWR